MGSRVYIYDNHMLLTCESYSFQIIDRGEAERRLSNYAKSTRRRVKRVLFRLLARTIDRG